MPDPQRSAFSYAVIRVVPHVERGEGFNAGVVLFCRQLDFLGAMVALDERRLAALAPDYGDEDWWVHGRGSSAFLSEIVKYLYYRAAY